MDNNDLDDFCRMFAVVAGYYGKDKTRESALLYWNALQAYPFEKIKEIFNTQIRTSRFMPMVSDILEVLASADGRPGAEEAWAIVAPSIGNESVSIVWTDEMRAAYGVAYHLADDHVAARMAFKEAYQAEVMRARNAGVPARWEPSLGHDPAGRTKALTDAVAKNRLTAGHAQDLIPANDDYDRGRIGTVRELLAAPKTGMPASIRAALKKKPE